MCAVIVKLTSSGPAFFAQERVGRDAETFKVYKLRTMVADAEAQLIDLRQQNEADGPLFKMSNDPRVTPFGRFLRKFSLDELPQLWNVVRGDMSLVGPRPALPREVAEWGDEVFDRLRVRPGITGMWQVSGRSDSTFEEYLRLDLYYVDNWSILVDVAILLRTRAGRDELVGRLLISQDPGSPGAAGYRRRRGRPRPRPVPVAAPRRGRDGRQRSLGPAPRTSTHRGPRRRRGSPHGHHLGCGRPRSRMAHRLRLLDRELEAARSTRSATSWGSTSGCC